MERRWLLWAIIGVVSLIVALIFSSHKAALVIRNVFHFLAITTEASRISSLRFSTRGDCFVQAPVCPRSCVRSEPIEGTTEVIRKGDIAVGQVKLTIPIRGIAMKIPLSISLANRTELIRVILGIRLRIQLRKEPEQ